MNKKILVLAEIINGGEWIATTRLLFALKKRNNKTKFDLIGFASGRKQKEELFNNQIYVSHATADKPLSFIKKLFLDFIHTRRAISNYLQVNNPDYIISTDYLLTLSAYSCWRGKNLFYFFHGLRSLPISDFRRLDYRQIILKFLERLSLSIPTVVIAPSAYAQKFITKIIWPSRKKILIIPNIIPAIYFNKHTKRELTILKKKLRFRKEEKIILYSGRIVKHKGLENLVRAHFQLSRKIKTKLILAYPRIGIDNDVWLSLGRFIRNNQLRSSIKFIPDSTGDEMVKLYTLSDVVILPSELEFAPLSILEAFAGGTPVVATNVGNIIEILGKIDGRLILKNNSPKEINHALQTFFNLSKKEKEKIVKKGKEVARHYSEENSTKEFKRILSFLR